MKHPPQEEDLVPNRVIGTVGAGVVAAIVAGSLIAYGIAACRTTDIRAGATTRTATPKTFDVNAMERSLFTAEAQGLDATREADAVLTSYGWVDRDHQIVRVPIDVATEIYLARRAQPTGGTR